MPLPLYMTEDPKPAPAKAIIQNLLNWTSGVTASCSGQTITLVGLATPFSSSLHREFLAFQRQCNLGGYNIDVIVPHVAADLENILLARGFQRVIEDHNHPVYGHHILWRHQPREYSNQA